MRRWLPWALAGVSLALTAAAAVLLLLSRSTPPPTGTFGFRGFAILLALAFTAVGPLIAARRPGNPIGWLLLAAGLASAIQAFTAEYAIYAVLAHPRSLPAGRYVAWVQAWVWMVPVGILGGLVFPLFPNGRLLSRRWRVVPWLAAVGMVLGIVGTAVAPGPLQAFGAVVNPFGVQGSNPLSGFEGGGLPFIAAILAGAVSLFVRFRRADGLEREQVKWLAYSGAVVAVLLVPAGLTASASSTSVWSKAM